VAGRIAMAAFMGWIVAKRRDVEVFPEERRSGRETTSFFAVNDLLESLRIDDRASRRSRRRPK